MRPVNSMEDLFAGETMWEQRALIRVANADPGRGVARPVVVPQMSAIPGGVHHAGPERGVHTDGVLRESLGLSDAEIAALTDAGTIA